ncbi:probable E3 ubiquitin-protein ligase BAH1-like 2 isoform X5 [Cryptomeria japonica]|uniref:probable E3 ubiquitin-protein ligase BAH1-like 2 isoform X5 n=1 Tax=Cryptomeria japonica TaxID=3369 RepID=UPI0025AC3083|nr:probable E3 ubiquitin-protein ligase BAH1-like 2 isoform X5 [Cryptomeria japonica]
MKFCKRYREYMQGLQDQLPGVSFKKFKKVLKQCTVIDHKQGGKRIASDAATSSGELNNDNNSRDGVGLLIRCPNPTSCPSKFAGKQVAMIQEGNNLIHYSKQGREFRTHAQIMQMEILHSPLLNELIAFHTNLMNDSNNLASVSGEWSLTFDGGKPSLSCILLDSLKIDIDLTCSICLETLFDPVSLKCGHMFCYSCACAAASVTIIEGLERANRTSKCPLCRQESVFTEAVRLVELNILLSKRCEEYWEQRLQRERIERLQQAKKHWEDQCRAFMGL